MSNSLGFDTYLLPGPHDLFQLPLNDNRDILFSGGWVNHQAPAELSHAYADVIADDKRFHVSGGYSPTIGMPECRAALVLDFADKEIVWGDSYPEYFAWGPTDDYVSIHSDSKWCRGLGRRSTTI